MKKDNKNFDSINKLRRHKLMRVKRKFIIVLCFIIFCVSLQVRINRIELNAEPFTIGALTFASVTLVVALLAAAGITFYSTQDMQSALADFSFNFSPEVVASLNSASRNSVRLDGRNIYRINQELMEIMDNYIISHFTPLQVGNQVINDFGFSFSADLNVPVIDLAHFFANGGVANMTARINDQPRYDILRLVQSSLRGRLLDVITLNNNVYTARIDSVANPSFRVHIYENGERIGHAFASPPIIGGGLRVSRDCIAEILGFALVYGETDGFPVPAYTLGVFSKISHYEFLGASVGTVYTGTSLAISTRTNVIISPNIGDIIDLSFTGYLEIPNLLADPYSTRSSILDHAKLANPDDSIVFSVPVTLDGLVGVRVGDVVVPGSILSDLPNTDTWDDAEVVGLLGNILNVLNNVLDAIKSLSASISQTLSVALVGDMTLNFDKVNNRVPLSNVFPFSIPWDLTNAVESLRVAPVAPSFSADFSGTVLDGYSFELDLSEYDSVAQIIRWSVWIAFFIGLIVGTSKLIKW